MASVLWLMMTHETYLDLIVEDALKSDAPVAVPSDCDDSPEASFLTVFLKMSRRFGNPDFPSDAPCKGEEFREMLRIEHRLLAIWDFDYYLLLLYVAEDQVWLSTGKSWLNGHRIAEPAM